MKSVINGIRYNTEKSTEIGSASNGYTTDMHYWTETLYKAPRSGRFFIAGEGGAMSRYSRQTSQNEWGSGHRIVPMSPGQAQEWCEQYLDNDEWSKYFDGIEDA